MTDRKTILVTGATGAQGGSVARHLLQTGKFAVRCFTRNVHSPKAQALRDAGAEVAQGRLRRCRQPACRPRWLLRCFRRDELLGAFDKEYQQGKNLVDAVHAAGVEHFVFSTLPYAKNISGGELDVPHLDIKGQLEEYSRSLGMNATFVHVAFYYENFLTFFPLQKQDDGSYAFGFPQGETPLATYAVEDTGGVVSAIFNDPARFKNQTVGIVGDDRPAAEYAEIMTRVLGVPVVYHHIPREVFASFGFPGANDLANMFDFNRRFILGRQADLMQSKELYPPMQSFEEWLQANRNLFQTITGD
jgi:uncharacterized protein YbjT (DUF2867 family)